MPGTGKGLLSSIVRLAYDTEPIPPLGRDGEE
jgi:hypothetical protein